MIRNLVALAGAAGLLATSSFAADVSVPRTITSSTTWTADNTYYLEGYTFVVTPSGAASPTVLTIEPGTVIKGRQSTGANAAALIITRGAQINAEGTADQPIIFTSELDNLNGNLDHTDVQLWGGVIILGSASINSRADKQIVAAPIEDQVEGLEVTGAEAAYATFGGSNDDDNSGVLRYVSIRHGGAVIGGDNEINGLTLGGVGRGTTIDHIEVFANKDDGIEIFGGTVNLKHVALAFGADDGLDVDQGWRGKAQFVFVVSNDIGDDKSDKGGEWDGATAPNDASPLTNAQIYNMTAIGIGDATQPDGSAGRANTALNIRDNWGGAAKNSIFVNYAKMVDIEDDAADRWNAGEIDITNNIWWSHIAENNTADGLNARPTGVVPTSTLWSDSAKKNLIADPKLRGISYAADGGLDPRPAADSPALTAEVATVPDAWFTQTDYYGAFAPNSATWLEGWTKLSTDGYLAASTLEAGANNKLVNISTRCFVGTGDNVGVGGFVVEGSDPVKVLVRVAGPTLSTDPFNIGGALVDPVLTINAGSEKLYENDDWGTNANAAEIASVTAQVGGFPLLENSKDAALLVVLEPGSYTAVATGKDGSTGIAIIEVYKIPVE
ncbi:MAG: hypothetical protein D6781_10565 [Verrucomicrobia bacterium]|nr:MAG: hypothetical protein D6781_10565 [Verrucomicrobiota bacterium]